MYVACTTNWAKVYISTVGCSCSNRLWHHIVMEICWHNWRLGIQCLHVMWWWGPLWVWMLCVCCIYQNFMLCWFLYSNCASKWEIFLLMAGSLELHILCVHCIAMVWRKAYGHNLSLLASSAFSWTQPKIISLLFNIWINQYLKHHQVWMQIWI